MDEILRAGVIGAGVFGGYHAAKFAAHPDVRLVGVCDHHIVHAETLADRSGGAPFADEAGLIEAVDIVSIATPAIVHAPSALASVRAGRHVYVEKPLAARLEDARQIVAEADRLGVVVACGFLERAALQAMGLFAAPEQPLRLEAVRLGPASPRNLDVSVVLDLMIHDLDLACALGAGRRLGATASGRGGAHGLDAVEAEVAFEGGFTCRFHASRVAEARERTMRIVYPSGEVRVDFLAHSFENTTAFPLDKDFEDAPASRDRLGSSIGAFIAAVRGEQPRPLATGEDGLKALELALAIEAGTSPPP